MASTQGLIDRGGGDYTLAGGYGHNTRFRVTQLSGAGHRAIYQYQGRASSWSSHTGVIDGQGNYLTLDQRYTWIDNGLYDMSRDGTTVVGRVRPTSDMDSDSMSVKSVIGGTAQIAVNPLGMTASNIVCISADASIVAGSTGNGSNTFGYIWGPDGAIAVPPPEGYTYASFSEMNDDATVLIGQVARPGQAEFAIYFAGTGWAIASEYFAANGVTIPEGRRISWLNNISSDGRTFTGELDNGQHFVAVVPSPGVVGVLAAFGLMASRRRVRGGGV